MNFRCDAIYTDENRKLDDSPNIIIKENGIYPNDIYTDEKDKIKVHNIYISVSSYWKHPYEKAIGVCIALVALALSLWRGIAYIKKRAKNKKTEAKDSLKGTH